jgi:hypothetical protein
MFGDFARYSFGCYVEMEAIFDYAANPPGVETPGYRLKPAKAGWGNEILNPF